MNFNTWLGMFLLIAIGYVLHAYFPQIGQKIGIG